MTWLDRIVWWPTLAVWAFVRQFGTRKGRRLVRRRAFWRLLVAVSLAPWVLPFFIAWRVEAAYVRGRVQVRGDPAPITDLAVVLVPAGSAPAGRPAAPAGLEIGVRPAVDVWVWPDVDGWFSTNYVVPGALYRVEVRRPGCRAVSLGERRFLFSWGRGLRLEVGSCERV